MLEAPMRLFQQRLLPRLPRPLRAVPTPALALISLLVVVNLVVWAIVGVVLRFYPRMTGSAVLAYTLGLRHALDADHISAIDLMTRRLIAAGQRPVAVGTFFSLGHSTIVVVTCIIVAATSGALRGRFDGFTRVGNVIGTSVSAAFLLILCAGNAWVLWRLIRSLRVELQRQNNDLIGGEQEASAGTLEETGYSNVNIDAGNLLEPEVDADAVAAHDLESGPITAPVAAATAADISASPSGASPSAPLQLEGGGFLSRVFRRLFVLIDRPWKMFPLGVLFGLGFDTSSEVALLGIASIQGAQGTSMWLILIFPALFTVGMCMLDTTDGALMMALYTSKVFSRDTIAILYYSIVLTGITILVSAFIGIIQVLTLADNIAHPTGRLWDGVGAIGDHFDIIGGCICGLFLIAGVGSVLAYKPWRRHMDRRQAARLAARETSRQSRQEHQVAVAEPLSDSMEGGALASSHFR